MADKHLDTALVHAGRSKKYTLGSVNSVIQRASSLVFDTVEAKKHATRNRAKGELFYGRRGTLTHFSLQEAMCELEGARRLRPLPLRRRRRSRIPFWRSSSRATIFW
ncbi:cystathionine beta-lyase [Klebsiella michiganensis]|uniref:Cystathionine beta-lyase n=1 Tax=Klebsiella michiganensis TaxID=1134687 RepID=A0A7H4M603_9ENTR|nr:cystathionine beta-lyase [Klebsiella michiganensis]